MKCVEWFVWVSLSIKSVASEQEIEEQRTEYRREQYRWIASEGLHEIDAVTTCKMNIPRLLPVMYHET
jgi:hypothetical protein